ncbi:DeoR/GlpR family DNA-binding transcription regulator [Uliginosibacterium gangwonense]|uniref:DeoR/GlpR family DNA-binding transcription regulator n=1 Tax=Uliginosibacterium gangwonense TaxID=392736 RepID=UPI000380FC33|nr:DeoR/GlpR family DNA-binding transcription regulator [Uliginosibacterium gangwonense]
MGTPAEALVDHPAVIVPPAQALLPVQRRQHILEFLQRHGAATLQQLAYALGVSVSTLRRDLDALAEERVLDRTHGGAILRHPQYSTFEPDAHAAAELSMREKRAIAHAAAAMIKPNQSVIFDSGSTTLEAARAVLARNIPLVCVTNDVEIAKVLGSSSLMQVHVLGGRMRCNTNTLLGDAVIQASRALRADVLLMGVHAVTEDVLSETSPELASVKQALIQAANRRCLLVDSSKFRPRAFASVCTLADIDEVFTDDGISHEDLERLRAASPRLTLAEHLA